MPRGLPLSELATPDLEYAALIEAQEFELPPDWRNGRELRHGFAVDASYSQDCDDAISATTSDSGEDILHVSIADTGSFLGELPAVTALAQRFLHTLYRRDRVLKPMIPAAISEDKLSFLHQQERPAISLHIPMDTQGRQGELTVSREIMQADRLTTRQVDQASAVDETPFHQLSRIAQQLYVNRQDGGAGLDTERRVVTSQQISPARFVLQECMISANIAIGQYFVDNDIPALFRRHDVSVVSPSWLGSHQLPHRLEQNFARATYTPSMSRHLGLRALNVAPFTAPLRRFADFANHRNLAAHLDGEKEFPFDEEMLQYVAKRYERLTGSESDDGKGNPQLAS